MDYPENNQQDQGQDAIPGGEPAGEKPAYPGDIPGLFPGTAPGAAPGGWQQPQGAWGAQGFGGWQPPPPKKGFFRGHPLLIIVLFFLLAVLLTVILGGLFGGRGSGTAAMPAMSAFGKKVGVIKVEGLIMESMDVVDQIHRFRDEGSVTAVVVRVDSPGGTVGASQEIYTELAKLAVDKPVVVSMGSVAASGGYYISCPATVIYANPGTITGSIGVVMEVANLEGLFEWMKIKNYVIKSGEWKDIGSPYREMTREERKYLQDFVDSLHVQFEEAVAAGRDLPLEKVQELADGRIYNGEAARELGLVDEIGTLWDAIDEAGRKGGIEGKPRVIWPPKPRPPLFQEIWGRLLPGLPQNTEIIPSPVRAMYVMSIN